jgi:predicted nuclease of predicted toxin-antitoxin system
MRIKLDENLPGELAKDLRRLGHLVDTVADEGLEGQPDPIVAEAPRSAKRCLFSLDKGPR